MMLPEKVVDSKKIKINLDYIKDARIDFSNIYDFTNKSLIVEFNQPINVLSTLEGERNKVKTIGNHYSPLSCWAVGHKEGLEGIRERVFRILNKSEKDSSFLFTAADVERFAIVEEKYKDLSIYAVVTAGVESNAMRMSKDDGDFYEPGTVNILILPNMKFTKRAMTRAIITATEAKSAALQDLDIRSVYKPEYQATGTGTDNLIIVEGSGDKPLDNSGGHTKLGELIAKAVYKGVTEAVYNQNGFISGRDIFQRLKERKISIGSNLSFEECECGITKRLMSSELEKILLKPEYASFISSSFSLSDDYERGLITDLTQFEKWCITAAEEISGKEIAELKEYIVDDSDAPVVIRMAMNALLNGIFVRE